jgi:FkbM family methyltransferase
MSRQYLEYLSAAIPLEIKHLNYLYSLKMAGFEPKVIYDIGACVLHWTKEAKKLWPDAKIILFDAFAPAEFMYAGYDYHIGVLSDTDGKEVKFYQNDTQPGGNSYYREIGNRRSAEYFPDDGYVMKTTAKLDTIVKQRGFPLPDFVKIDVQGAELDVIAGGASTFAKADQLIVELQHNHYNEGAKLVGQSVPIIESYGWTCTAPLFCNNGDDGDYGFSRPNSVVSRRLQFNTQLKWMKRWSSLKPIV